MNLTTLENKLENLDNEVKELSGSIKTLEQQYTDSVQSLKELKELQNTNIKAVELLDFVQKVTKDLIKDTFENVTTQALQFIHQDDNYEFELDFGRRGAIPELNFKIKTPDMQEAHSILDTRGGGTADVVSLALRLVLLEVAKMKGFLFLDEPEKHLDSPETLQKMLEFIQEMQRETKRQIFWITHKQEVVDSVPNPIIIKEKGSQVNEHSQKVNDKPKRKRGRPKGSKNAKKN